MTWQSTKHWVISICIGTHPIYLLSSKPHLLSIRQINETSSCCNAKIERDNRVFIEFLHPRTFHNQHISLFSFVSKIVPTPNQFLEFPLTCRNMRDRAMFLFWSLSWYFRWSRKCITAGAPRLNEATMGPNPRSASEWNLKCRGSEWRCNKLWCGITHVHFLLLEVASAEYFVYIKVKVQGSLSAILNQVPCH